MLFCSTCKNIFVTPEWSNRIKKENEKRNGWHEDFKFGQTVQKNKLTLLQLESQCYGCFFIVIDWSLRGLICWFSKLQFEVKPSNFQSDLRSHFLFTISTFFFISRAWPRNFCVFGLRGVHLWAWFPALSCQFLEMQSVEFDQFRFDFFIFSFILVLFSVVQSFNTHRSELR